MTNYETAKKLFDIARGLDEVWQKRDTIISASDDDYKTETMAIAGARDRIAEIATELAKSENIENEQNKIDDDEAKDNLEDDINN